VRACAIYVPVFRNRKDERYDAETSCTVSGIPNLSCPAVSQYGEPVVLFQPVSIIQKLRVQTLQIRAVFIQRPDYVGVKRYSLTTLVHPPTHNLTPVSVFFKGAGKYFSEKIHTGPRNPVWCHLMGGVSPLPPVFDDEVVYCRQFALGQATLRQIFFC